METTEPVTLESAADSLLLPNEPEQLEEVAEVEEVAEEVTDAEEVETEDLELDADEDTAEDDGDFDETEEDDDDTEEEASEQPKLYTVPVDGVDVQATLEELKQDFSGRKYIQKGMQEAADQKKHAEQIFNALQQEQARLAQLYQTMQQGGVVQAPVKPSPQMAQDDPIGYISAMADFDAKKEAFDQQQAQFSQVTEQQTQAQAQAMQAYVAEQRQVLERDIPEFADAEKGRQIQNDIRSMGERYGFSTEELSGISDARVVKVMHAAMKWEKLQASKGKVEKKAKKARPVTKPKAPRKVNAEAKRRDQMRDKLKSTGSIDAAVELLMGN